MDETVVVCGLKLSPQWSRGLQEEELKRKLIETPLTKEVVIDSTLPNGVTKLHEVVLGGSCMMQVVSASDITKSKRSIQKGIEEEDNEEGGNQKYARNVHGKRMFKIHLTDGLQDVFAVEYDVVPDLKGVPGEKLIVTDPLVRRGLMLLHSGNTKSVGVGQVNKEKRNPPPNSSSSSSASGNDAEGGNDGFDSGSRRQTQGAISSISSPASGNTSNRRGKRAAETQIMSSAVSLTSVDDEEEFVTPTQDLVVQERPSKKSRTADPKRFGYLQDLGPGDTRLVKCFISHVIKANVRKGILFVEIADGISVFPASVCKEYTENGLLTMKISDAAKLRDENKPKYKQLMKETEKRIREAEGIFKVTMQRDRSLLVHEITDPTDTKDYTEYLFKQLSS